MERIRSIKTEEVSRTKKRFIVLIFSRKPPRTTVIDVGEASAGEGESVHDIEREKLKR